jgi:hypothetical protein
MNSTSKQDNSTTISDSTKKKRGSSGGNKPTPTPPIPTAFFPEKLFKALQQIELHEPELADAISWQPSGRSFRVRNVVKFEDIILPRFFNLCKHASFRRQLNLWGFRRIIEKASEDHGSYCHDLFIRGDERLLRTISRHGPKQKCVGSSADHDNTAAIGTTNTSTLGSNDSATTAQLSAYPAVDECTESRNMLHQQQFFYQDPSASSLLMQEKIVPALYSTGSTNQQEFGSAMQQATHNFCPSTIFPTLEDENRYINYCNKKYFDLQPMSVEKLPRITMKEMGELIDVVSRIK